MYTYNGESGIPPTSSSLNTCFICMHICLHAWRDHHDMRPLKILLDRATVPTSYTLHLPASPPLPTLSLLEWDYYEDMTFSRYYLHISPKML